MVEINNQRKRRSSICWRGRRELMWTSENQKSWLWRHCGRRAILLITRSPSQTCHAKPQNSNQQAPDATSFFPVGGMPTASSLAWKTSLRKVRTLWHCSRLRAWRFMIVVVSVRQSLTVAAISGLHCRGAWFMVSSSIRLTAWLQNSKKRAERSERLMYEQSHRDYLHALVICIIVCLSWAVNVNDNSITYKADKKCRELKLANAAITDMQMRQRDVAALDAKYTKG